jgi:hypothetical protein
LQAAALIFQSASTATRIVPANLLCALHQLIEFLEWNGWAEGPRRIFQAVIMFLRKVEAYPETDSAIARID